MFRRIAPIALLTVCALSAASFAPAAEDYLKLAPEEALGMVAVNDPSEMDAKIQSFALQARLPIPGLLMTLDRFAGREGFDEKGTVVLYVLPPRAKGSPPSPLLLVPVVDFDKFLEKHELEEHGDEPVASFEAFDQKFWVREIGGYAALTEDRYREVLFRENLKIASAPLADLTPWREWLSSHDAAGVLLPRGIELISARVQEGVEQMRSSMFYMDESALAVFDLYAKMFKAAERELAGYGFGLRFDRQCTIRASDRALLKPEGKWAALAKTVRPMRMNLLAGLPEGNFVAAAGCVSSEAAIKALMESSLGFMKCMKQVYGLDDEQIDELSTLSLQSLEGVRAMSMLVQADFGADPLPSKAVYVMRVDDSRRFLDRYRQWAARYAEFLEKAGSPMLQPPEVEKCEVDGVEALRLTTKVPAPPAELQGPGFNREFNRLMELFFGADGELAGWLVPADEHTVVLGYVKKNLLRKTIEAIKQDAPGLAAAAEVKGTAALLPSDPVAVGYLSPAGVVDFFMWFLPAVAPPGAELSFPDLPRTPVGFAVTVGENEVQTHLAVPGEVTRSVAGQLQKLFGLPAQPPPPAMPAPRVVP